MWTWTQTRQPRPNVRIHPLDAYQMKERLRGDVEECEETPEAVLVWGLAAFIVWGIVAIIWMAI